MENDQLCMFTASSVKPHLQSVQGKSPDKPMKVSAWSRTQHMGQRYGSGRGKKINEVRRWRKKERGRMTPVVERREERIRWTERDGDELP